jgi:hypothetical protein
MLRKLSKNCSARRGNEFVGFVPLTDGNSPENLECGRGGNGEATMLALDPTASLLQFRGVNRLNPKRLDPDADTNDVGDRIQRSHLVKMHFFRGGSVNLCLGDCYPVKNGKRTLFDEGREVAL